MQPPQIDDVDGVLVITLDDPGDLNDPRTVGLRQPLLQAVQAAQAPRIAVDLKAVDAVTSSGIALLIGLKRRVEQRQGRLVLFNVHPHVRDVFVVMRLAGLFTMADDRASALELLPPSPAN